MAATAISVTHMESSAPMAIKARTIWSVRRPTLVNIQSMKRRASPEEVMAADRPMAPIRKSSTLLPKPSLTRFLKFSTPRMCRKTRRQSEVAGKGMASVIHRITAKQSTAMTILPSAVREIASVPL